MKKLLVMFLALALLSVGCLSLAQPAALAEDGEGVENPIPPIDTPTLEEPLLPAEARVPGDWYGLHHGLLFCLSFQEDGSFTLAVSGSPLEPIRGTWLVEGNCLYLNGTDTEPLLVLDDSLLWEAVGLRFTREMPETFRPTEEFYELTPGDPDGLWRCRYVGAGGVVMEAEALGEDTLLYIEGENVALGGAFGDIPLVFAFEDGAMVARLDEGETKAVLTLRLQMDGVLRLSLETDGEAAGPVDFYLLPQTPANAELPAEP